MLVPDANVLGSARPEVDFAPFRTELGRHIYLDRYALKAMDSGTAVVGDTVVVHEGQGVKSRSWVGQVTVVGPNGCVVVQPEKGGDVVVVRHDSFDLCLETQPAQTWDRMAEGAAALEVEGARRYWREEFRWALDGFKFVPAGRVWTGLGRSAGKDVTLSNCLAAETLVVLDTGATPVGKLKGMHRVLSQDGVYREAEFRSYGVQQLYSVELENGQVIHATADHQWVTGRKVKGKYRRVPTSAMEGKRVPVVPGPKVSYGTDWKAGVTHGVIFGDGSRRTHYANIADVTLCHEKRELAGILVGGNVRPETTANLVNQQMRVTGFPGHLKDLPAPDKSPEYWAGFLSGLIATDGHVDRRGHVMVHSSDRDFLASLAKNLAGTGFIPGRLAMTRDKNPWNGTHSECWKLSILRCSVQREDILRSQHLKNWDVAPQRNKPVSLKVVRVTETSRHEEVFCCVEPETHTIVVGHGVLTGQCFVLDHFQDSREGIFERLQQFTDAQARGGGVGINISSLRYRGAPIRKVNGRSSGSVSWAALFAYVSRDLVSQGGSRRGASLVLLEDWHPDVLEFISCKTKPGFMEGANISVGISDGFMQAVKEGKDWELIFPDTDSPHYRSAWMGDIGEWRKLGLPIIVHQTLPARELWEKITTSAWASAEPGLVFLERMRKEANSSYYANGKIVCVNPCAEEPLSSNGACLASEVMVCSSEGIRRMDSFSSGPVTSFGGDWELATHAQYIPQGRKPVLKVTFDGGLTLRCTEDHRLILHSGEEVMAVDSVGCKVRWMDRNPLLVPLQDHPSAVLAATGNGNCAVMERSNGSLDRALMLGWMHGDGWMTENSIGISFNNEDGDFTIKDRILNEYHATFSQRKPLRDDGVSYQEQTETAAAYTFLEDHGITLTKAASRVLPKCFFGLPLNEQLMFLRGIFTADGWVAGKAHTAIGYSTSSPKLAEQLQQVLAALGIQSRMLRTSFPSSERKDQYRLTITKGSARKFMHAIGFATPAKQNKFQWPSTNVYQDVPWLRVISVEEDGVSEVHDLTVPATHVFFANGVLVHNCNLGHIHLGMFATGRVGRPVVAMDMQGLARTIQAAVRFQDNLIDIGAYPFPEAKAQQLLERRIGLGTLGLAEAMISAGVKYGGEEGVEWTRELYSFIAAQAYSASMSLADERGPFPAYDERFWEQPFARKMAQKLHTTGPIRNVTLLTAAPTGSIGTMVGTSTGIEPFFELEWEREGRFGKQRETAWIVDEYRREHVIQNLPEHFVTAMDLSPVEHIKMQAVVQDWVDASVSKTANLPAEYTPQQVKELYELMYELGCKGGTVYRDGCRTEQVLSRVVPTEGDAPSEMVEITPILTAPVMVQNLTQEAKTPTNGKPKIVKKPSLMPCPNTAPSIRVRKDTPNGTAHIHAVTVDGDPHELFVDVGKAGSDLKGMAEALGRMVSLVLRLRSEVSGRERVELIVDQLEGIGGPRTAGFGDKQVRSVPDAVAQVLQDLWLRDDGEVEPSGWGMSTMMVEAVVERVKVKIKADLCPRCGNHSYRREGGCTHCSECGHSAC